MQIVKLQQMQRNAEALKKVETQDASIKAKISSVMHHVEQVDKEKQALALGDSRLLVCVCVCVCVLYTCTYITHVCVCVYIYIYILYI